MGTDAFCECVEDVWIHGLLISSGWFTWRCCSALLWLCDPYWEMCWM